MPSAGWTVGDAPATERTSGHAGTAAPTSTGWSPQAAANPSFDAIKAVDRAAGTHAQQRILLDQTLRNVQAEMTGPAKTLIDTIIAWDGSYDTTDAAGTVDPGVAAWEALKDEAVKLLPRHVAELARRARPLARVRLRRRRRRRPSASSRTSACRRPRQRRGRGSATRLPGGGRDGCTT